MRKYDAHVNTIDYFNNFLPKNNLPLFHAKTSHIYLTSGQKRHSQPHPPPPHSPTPTQLDISIILLIYIVSKCTMANTTQLFNVFKCTERIHFVLSEGMKIA